MQVNWTSPKIDFYTVEGRRMEFFESGGGMSKYEKLERRIAELGQEGWDSNNGVWFKRIIS